MSEQCSYGGAMPVQIKQELADVAVATCDSDEMDVITKGCDDYEATAELEDCGAERLPAGGFGKTICSSGEIGDQGCQGVNVHAGIPTLIYGQTVGAHHEHGLGGLAPGQVADHVTQTVHSYSQARRKLEREGKGRSTRKSSNEAGLTRPHLISNLRQMRPHIPILVLGAAIAACSDPNALAPARAENLVDTVTIFALQQTPINTPSGFSVSSGLVTLSESSGFDFAFDFDEQGRPVLLSLGALGLAQGNTIQPGFQSTDIPFQDIARAPSNGYITDDTLVVDFDTRYFLRSRLVCSALGLPQYAKVEFLSQDTVERTLTFQVLANNNCGYRDLKPGIPSN